MTPQKPTREQSGPEAEAAPARGRCGLYWSRLDEGAFTRVTSQKLMVRQVGVVEWV
jgi:hypothetical protein